MAQLVSKVFSIDDHSVSTRSVFATKSLMPINGDMYIWYGEYTGTYLELKANGMLVLEYALLEHVNSHDGIISLVSSTGKIIIHEVM